jgi:HEAT repeat protein
MDFARLLADKALRGVQRKDVLAQFVLSDPAAVDEVLAFARTAKDADVATCLEAIEYATRERCEVGTAKCFDFAVAALASDAPRVKWEAAKVVGNTARLHPRRLGKAIAALLANTTHEGTVVRWSAGFALGEILVLGTSHNATLVPQAEAIVARETDNAIRKHYERALKKLAKTK